MLTTTLLLSLAACPQGPQHPTPRFAAPVRMKAADGYVKVEAPATPRPAGMTSTATATATSSSASSRRQDARLQGTEAGALLKGEWLQAEGAVAQVPGVW